MTRKQIQSRPEVASLEQWRDDSGRPEGWAAHLRPGRNIDGLSFARGRTLKEVAEELRRIKPGAPH